MSLSVCCPAHGCRRQPGAAGISPQPISAITHVRMVPFVVRWLQHGWQLLSESVTGRRLSFVLLLTTLGAHPRMRLLGRRRRRGRGCAPPALPARWARPPCWRSPCSRCAAPRGCGRSPSPRAAGGPDRDRALLDGPPVFVPALLAAPLLIEPVLYDDDRVAMALSAARSSPPRWPYWPRARAGRAAGTRALPGDIRAGDRPARGTGLGGGLPSRAGGRAHRARAQPGLHHRAPCPREPGIPGIRRDGQVGERRPRSAAAGSPRELHDTVGYALTNVIVMMDAAKARAHEEPQSLDSLLDDVRAQSELALNDTRADPAPVALRRAVRTQGGSTRCFQLTRAFQDAMGAVRGAARRQPAADARPRASTRSCSAWCRRA